MEVAVYRLGNLLKHVEGLRREALEVVDLERLIVETIYPVLIVVLQHRDQLFKRRQMGFDGIQELLVLA